MKEWIPFQIDIKKLLYSSGLFVPYQRDENPLIHKFSVSHF